jgi:hypothetical protein
LALDQQKQTTPLVLIPPGVHPPLSLPESRSQEIDEAFDAAL